MNACGIQITTKQPLIFSLWKTFAAHWSDTSILEEKMSTKINILFVCLPKRKNKRMNMLSKKIIFRKILVKIQLTVSHTQFINSVTTQQLTPISTSYIVEHTTIASATAAFFPTVFQAKQHVLKFCCDDHLVHSWWNKRGWEERGHIICKQTADFAFSLLFQIAKCYNEKSVVLFGK